MTNTVKTELVCNTMMSEEDNMPVVVSNEVQLLRYCT